VVNTMYGHMMPGGLSERSSRKNLIFLPSAGLIESSGLMRIRGEPDG
jgi:hypothetical protein